MVLDKRALIVELNNRIRLISNVSIFNFVRKMLDVVPPAFYERPASTDHHALDERGECGGLLHTIRVIDLVLVMANSCNMNQIRKDILVAGASLHDSCRHGLDGKSEHSVEDHPLLVRKLAEEHNLYCDCYDSIMGVIESHIGRWGKPPFTPYVDLETILHLADCINAHWLEDLQC